MAETNNSTQALNNEDILDHLATIRTRAMLLGVRATSKIILDKIHKAEGNSGRMSAKEYKALVEEIKRFCEVGVARKNNDENDSTKLMEETDGSTVN